MYTHPAVLIGGPPHSGKSVLLYALSQALRKANVEHYALRSCPDYEGDWSQEATPETVRSIRIKGGWTQEWVDSICRDIRNRHLPLLVDVGGRPTADQERIFDACTHAILLTKDEASHAEWSERVARHGLPLIADLTSVQTGESATWGDAPLTGVVAGLTRFQQSANPVVDVVTDLLIRLFASDTAGLRQQHLATAPVELAVDLDRVAITLGWAQPGAKVTWLPEHLPALLDYLPAATPLAAYGRGTNWLHASLARWAYPEAYFSFDVRLGWAPAQPLPIGLPASPAPLGFRLSPEKGALHVEGILPDSYIDITELADVVCPPFAAQGGVILSGKLPYWLYTSLAQTYADAPWLAVFQPQLAGAVVIHGAGPLHVGDLLSLSLGAEKPPGNSG